jgi:hypothetical protein
VASTCWPPSRRRAGRTTVAMSFRFAAGLSLRKEGEAMIEHRIASRATKEGS